MRLLEDHRVADLGDAALLFAEVVDQFEGLPGVCDVVDDKHPLIVQAALGISDAILEAAALGFLGLGAQPPLAEWGAMISDGRTYILDHWWVAAMPGLAIFIVSLAFNFLGDGLRDVLDPKGAGE